MPPPILDFHPRAADEVLAAQRWYARRSATAAARFAAAFNDAVSRLLSFPGGGTPHLKGTRFYSLRRFPYMIIYRESPVRIHVVAVSHTSRRPGYWRRRIP